MNKLNTIILLLFCVFLVKAQTPRSMRVDSVFNSRSYQSSSMTAMVQVLNKRGCTREEKQIDLFCIPLVCTIFA